MRKTMATGAVATAVLFFAGVTGAQEPGDVLIGEGAFPESIAATPDGGFLAGSVASPNIFRYAPGGEAASVWATVDGVSLGVFATADTAFACVIAPNFGDGRLVTFDLATAELTGTYPLPGGGLCNDIAVGPDGTVFVTDTGAFSGRPGSVLALVPTGEDGALALQPVLSSMSIGGADGLAFVGDTLYVNDVTTGQLFALELDGTTLVSLTTLTLSRALAGPDGMRTTADGTGLWVAENAAGRVSHVTIDGANATVDTVAEGGWISATAVAEVGGVLYVIDTNFPALGQPNAGAFYAHAVNPGM
jgi:sugar lactone lactonase YvrE